MHARYVPNLDVDSVVLTASHPISPSSPVWDIFLWRFVSFWNAVLFLLYHPHQTVLVQLLTFWLSICRGDVLPTRGLACQVPFGIQSEHPLPAGHQRTISPLLSSQSLAWRVGTAAASVLAVRPVLDQLSTNLECWTCRKSTRLSLVWPGVPLQAKVFQYLPLYCPPVASSASNSLYSQLDLGHLPIDGTLSEL